MMSKEFTDYQAMEGGGGGAAEGGASRPHPSRKPVSAHCLGPQSSSLMNNS